MRETHRVQLEATPDYAFQAEGKKKRDRGVGCG